MSERVVFSVALVASLFLLLYSTLMVRSFLQQQQQQQHTPLHLANININSERVERTIPSITESNSGGGSIGRRSTPPVSSSSSRTPVFFFFLLPSSLSLSLFCSVVYLKTRERKRTDAPPVVAFLPPFFFTE